MPDQMPDQTTLLYARREHGFKPVRVAESEGRQTFTLEGMEYTSQSALMQALTGRRGSFSSYFRLGELAKDPPPSQTVLGLFGNLDFSPLLPPRLIEPVKRALWAGSNSRKVRRAKPSDVEREVERAKTAEVDPARAVIWAVFGAFEGLVHPVLAPASNETVKRVLRRSRRLQPAQPAPFPGKGIDLVNRGHEVRKLLFAGFGKRIAQAGYDPDDVLQEVFRGILARNEGKCPWDAKKSSFGHYVHMVCECILNNYHRKQSRMREFEQIGMNTLGREGDWEESDAADAAVADQNAGTDEAVGLDRAVGSLGDWLSGMGERPEATLARQILPLLVEGYTRSEIAEQLAIDPSKVGRALNFLRKHSAEWAEDQDIVLDVG